MVNSAACKVNHDSNQNIFKPFFPQTILVIVNNLFGVFFRKKVKLCSLCKQFN